MANRIIILWSAIRWNLFLLNPNLYTVPLYLKQPLKFGGGTVITKVTKTQSVFQDYFETNVPLKKVYVTYVVQTNQVHVAVPTQVTEL